MATSKPISTISYNSESFLRSKLDDLYKAHIIQAWQYFSHKGEDGDKDHIHLRIEPNKKIDPMELSDLFREFVPGNDKPLGVRPWRPSKEEDWILYGLHDAQYLKLKYGGGEKGEKLPYTLDDMQVSDYYDKEVAYIRAKSSLAHTSQNLVKRLQGGENATTLLQEGENPYVVNACVRALSDNDYQRLAKERSNLEKENFKLQRKIEQLVTELEACGCIISAEDDDGTIYFSTISKETV